jgi:hypothetical protein
MVDTQVLEACARNGVKVRVLSVAPMEHDWDTIIVEYYEMDHDWKCKNCGAQTARTRYGQREPLEDFKVRLAKSPWLNVPVECVKK